MGLLDVFSNWGMKLRDEAKEKPEKDIAYEALRKTLRGFILIWRNESTYQNKLTDLKYKLVEQADDLENIGLEVDEILHQKITDYLITLSNDLKQLENNTIVTMGMGCRDKFKERMTAKVKEIEDSLKEIEEWYKE